MEKFVQDAIVNEDFEVLKRCRDTLNGTLFASKFISSLSLGEMVKSKSIHQGRLKLKHLCHQVLEQEDFGLLGILI